MILEVDIGNSRIKWRLRSGKNIVLSSISDHTHDMDSVFNLQGVQPTTVWVSTVAPSMQQTLSQWSRHRLDIRPQYATVTRRAAGVVNGYEVLEQMGVDRWLAMLAAFQMTKGPCIVVDCGTACTIDVVDDTGQHRGGYIVPGLKMMADVLLHNTEGVALPTAPYVIPPILGISTTTAVSAGLPAMIIGLLEYTLNNFPIDISKVSVLLTGGDSEQFQQTLTDVLGLKVDFQAELVLEGLQYAFLTENT